MRDESRFIKWHDAARKKGRSELARHMRNDVFKCWTDIYKITIRLHHMQDGDSMDVLVHCDDFPDGVEQWEVDSSSQYKRVIPDVSEHVFDLLPIHTATFLLDFGDTVYER